VERQAYAHCIQHGQTKTVKVSRMLGSNSAVDHNIQESLKAAMDFSP
jgi:hypothetical protein